MRWVTKIFHQITNFKRRRQKDLYIGEDVEFINKGTVITAGAAIGSIENISVKIANKSTRSYFHNTGIVNLGKNVRIHKGLGIIVSGRFFIGDNSYINPDCIIVCHNTISIGNDCAISWNVTIMDDDLHQISGSTKADKSIVIEDRVWIGAGVFITKGVRIGRGSVIAANTVVTKDVPNGVLFAGSPGAVVKRGIEWNL